VLKKTALLFSILIFSSTVYSQAFVESKPDVLKKLNISGSYRFFLQHRQFVDPYITGVNGLDTNRLVDRTILVGDATQLPELTLYIGANPSKNVSFGTDLTIWNQQTGQFDYFRGMNLGVNLYGSFKTPIGNYNIRTGGIHWLKLSRFTMKAAEGFTDIHFLTEIHGTLNTINLAKGILIITIEEAFSKTLGGETEPFRGLH